MDGRISGMGQMWFAAVLELGDVDVNYMRELMTKQEVFITREKRLQVEWLAHGKHAITIAPSAAPTSEFIRLGAPIKGCFLGTLYSTGATGAIGIHKGVPHPNAVKLFINWLLSQEGQTFHSQATGCQSQRLDVPNAYVEPSKVLKPGLKVYRADSEELSNKTETIYSKLALDVFGH